MKENQSVHKASTNTLLPDISAGLIIGILQIFLALSYAALIFSGPLTPFVFQGISLGLMGMIITGLVIGTFTSLPGVIGGSQGVPAAIMAVIVASIAAQIPSGGTSTQSFITVVVAIGLVTLLTGLIFWLMGHFQLGGLVRFLPFPVAGGFLAATGWLFFNGSIDMMIGQPVTFFNLSYLLQPAVIFQWLPALLLAILMLIATKRSDHYLILPAFLIGALILFFIITRLAGIGLEELGNRGWLLASFTTDRSATPPSFSLSIFGQINWSAIMGQLANIVAIIAVSTISLLLNAEGLELTTDRDLEVNHELQIAGIANILSGLTAGLVGYKLLSLSTLNFKLGSRSRIPSYIGAGICFLALIAGVMLLTYFPKIIVGSLLILLGLNFLYEWVFEGFFKLPKIDYTIVLVILFVTMSAGFLQAVALGLLLAVIMFVISYSQIDVVKHELDGSVHRSRVARSRLEEKLLTREGYRSFILELQGFVFFGTADSLLNRLRDRINNSKKKKPDYIILDFKRVTGLDSTGLLSFSRMKQLAKNEGIVLLFTNPNHRVLDQLIKGGLNDDGRHLRIYPSQDKALEWCENQILSGENGFQANTIPLKQQLKEVLFAHLEEDQRDAKIETLMKHLQRMEIEAGHQLISAGDRPEDLYLIETGILTAQLTFADRPPMRLETSGSGNVFGEIGFYIGNERTADVIAETHCVLYRLSMDNLQILEQSNPEAASTLHQLMARLLAERVVNQTNSIRILES